MPESLENSVNLPPSYRREMESMWKEIRKLQRSLRPPIETTRTEMETLFHHTGNLTVSTSQQFVYRRSAHVTDIAISLTGGSTATTFVIYKNNVIVWTIVVPASTNYLEVEVYGVAFDVGDTLKAGITVVGTGASDSVVQVRSV